MHLAETTITCPYCGEPIDVLIDEQDAGDQYIEDCQVCCQPIVFTLMIDEAGEPTLTVQAENDV